MLGTCSLLFHIQARRAAQGRWAIEGVTPVTLPSDGAEASLGPRGWNTVCVALFPVWFDGRRLQ